MHFKFGDGYEPTTSGWHTLFQPINSVTDYLGIHLNHSYWQNLVSHDFQHLIRCLLFQLLYADFYEIGILQ